MPTELNYTKISIYFIHKYGYTELVLYQFNQKNSSIRIFYTKVSIIALKVVNKRICI